MTVAMSRRALLSGVASVALAPRVSEQVNWAAVRDLFNRHPVDDCIMVGPQIYKLMQEYAALR